MSCGPSLRTILRKNLAGICMTKEFYCTVAINDVNLLFPRYQLGKISLKVFHVTQSITSNNLAPWFSITICQNYFTPYAFQRGNIQVRSLGATLSRRKLLIQPIPFTSSTCTHTHICVYKCICTLADLHML